MAPWLAAAGAFVVSLDSMMNIAFPSMAGAFAVPPETIRWVIICYTGVYAVMAFAGGALADMVGHRGAGEPRAERALADVVVRVRVFRAGIALTAVAFLAGA